MAESSDIKKEQKKVEEQGLINEALLGNQVAFNQLYHRYHQQVFAFCSRLLFGKSEVEDVVQQVFLEAWRSLKHFEGRSLFSTWLTKVAIHTCLSYRRRNQKSLINSAVRYESHQNITEVLWGCTINQPDTEIFLNEKKNLVNKLLSKMTPKKKVVFILSDMEGMSAPEISKILNIPDATVRTRLFHARKEFALWINKNKVFKEALLVG